MSVETLNEGAEPAAYQLRSKTGIKVALNDIIEALAKYRLALIFGWQDVAQRYRRSRVGAFWLTLNMAVLIGALGAIFGTLFQSKMYEYLPHVCAGIIMWSFITSCLSEGCTAFSGSAGIILQVRMPLFTHILRGLPPWGDPCLLLVHAGSTCHCWC